MSSGRALARGRRLAARSPRRARFMAKVRVPLVRSMFAESPWCELGERIATVDEDHVCTRRAEGLHELRKRSAGGSMTNRANLLRACNACNGWVENFPRLAHWVRLVVREGDPLWEDLGA